MFSIPGSDLDTSSDFRGLAPIAVTSRPSLLVVTITPLRSQGLGYWVTSLRSLDRCGLFALICLHDLHILNSEVFLHSFNKHTTFSWSSDFRNRTDICRPV